MSSKSIADSPLKIHIAVNRTTVNKDVVNEWQHNNGFTNEHLTVDELVTAIRAGRAFTSPHQHRNLPKPDGGTTAYRTSENWIESQHDGSDFDHSSFADVLQISLVRDYAAFLYATTRHTAADPRSRAVFIFDQVVTDRDYYAKIKKAIVWRLGGVVDKSCKDVARQFFGSKDCEVLMLNNVMPLAVADQLIAEYEAEQAAAQEERAKKAAARAANGETYATTDDAEKTNLALHALATWRAEQYDPWLSIGMALHAWGDNAGLALWHEFSQRCPEKYNPDQVDAKWKSFKSGGGITIASIFKWADEDSPGWRRTLQRDKTAVEEYEHGFAASADMPNSLDLDNAAPAGEDDANTTKKTEKATGPGDEDKRFNPHKAKRALRESGYCDWRWNLVTEQIEVAIANDRMDPDPADVTWTVLNDGIEATIRTSMRSNGWKNMDAIRDLWMSLAYQNRYHPIKDYLTRLQWDGKNHIGALALYFECTDPPVLIDGLGKVSWHEMVLERWLVGAAAKVLHDGTLRAQNPMLVFAGPQGIGKSSFTHWLCSGAGDGFFTSESINPDSPEHQRYLAEKWIWESGELGTTTRRQDVEALKAFLTREVVTYRVPYAKHSVHKPALASFVGTVNPEMAGGFLVDITGNRRFVTCTIKRIFHDYVTRVDVNQVWAQAVHLYKTGFDWRLPQNMQAARDRVNEAYMVPDALESYVLAHFEVDPDQHGEGAKDIWFTPTYQIVDRLITAGIKEGTTALTMKLSKTLSGLKVPKGRQQTAGATARQTGYFGIREKEWPQKTEWRPE